MEYGLWTPYLDEPAMLTWYPLPENLLAECQAYTPDGTELDALPSPRFVALRQTVIAYADASVTNLPYHGPQHFRQVEEHGLAAAQMIESLTSRSFPVAVKQALAIALRLHDCHHTGSTFRADAPDPELLYRPEAGTTIATEWVSSLAANDLSRRHQLPLPSRLFQMMVIWSSTFGGQTPRGQELGIPNVQPEGLWGRLMRAADVCPPTDFRDWMAGAIAVNYAEIPATPPPATWDGFLQAQLGFSGYIHHCFNQLDAAAQAPVTRELGWRSNLAQLRNQLRSVIHGSDPSSQTIKAMLAARHTTLT